MFTELRLCQWPLKSVFRADVIRGQRWNPHLWGELRGLNAQGEGVGGGCELDGAGSPLVGASPPRTSSVLVPKTEAAAEGPEMGPIVP